MDRVSRAGGKPVRLVMRVPGGTPGIYVGDSTDFKRPQDGFVLARGTRCKVVSRSDGEMVLEVVAGHGAAD